MRTCFTNNAAAQRLFCKLGYSKDETSPDPAVDGPGFAGCVPSSRAALGMGPVRRF